MAIAQASIKRALDLLREYSFTHGIAATDTAYALGVAVHSRRGSDESAGDLIELLQFVLDMQRRLEGLCEVAGLRSAGSPDLAEIAPVAGVSESPRPGVSVQITMPADAGFTDGLLTELIRSAMAAGGAFKIERR